MTGPSAVGGGHPSAGCDRLFLLLLWPPARHREHDIVRDLEESFDVLSSVELQWSGDRFGENLSRFYGRNLPISSNKRLPGGPDALRVVVFRDPCPSYEERPKNHGSRLVNKNVFDRKQLYRSWTGGGHRIHSSENAAETLHDLVTLLGPDFETFLDGTGPTERTLVRDVPGAGGWKSLSELFHTLNAAMPYVVLRHHDGLPHEPPADGVVTLCVESRLQARFLLDLSPAHADPHRARMTANVGGHSVGFDLRGPGDGFLDSAWQANLLRSRRFTAGVFVPDHENRFFADLYQSLTHAPSMAPDAVSRLSSLAAAAKVELRWDVPADDPASPTSTLTAFLRPRGYRVVRPQDPSVPFSPARTLARERIGRLRSDIVGTLERARVLRPIRRALSTLRLVRR